MLTSDQMQILIGSSSKFLGLIAEDSTYLNQVVMCDETWVHHYDPLTKWESEHWKRKNKPQENKVQQQKSMGKVGLIVFFDHWEPLYLHFVLPGTTANNQYYLEVLKILRQHINLKFPKLKELVNLTPG